MSNELDPKSPNNPEIEQILQESQSTYESLDEEEKAEIHKILEKHIKNQKITEDAHDMPSADTQGLSKSNLLGLWVLMVITTLCLLAVYHLNFKSPSVLGTVDIAAVVKIKEQQFTELLSRSNTTDADRQAAYSLVNSIGPDIERALDIVQKKCGCTLVVKNAVLAGSANDYTDVLKEQLGMTKGGN